MYVRAACLVLGIQALALARVATASAVEEPRAAPVSPDAPADPRAAEDARARAAFQRLDARGRREVIDFLEAESTRSGSFQSALVQWVLKRQDRDPATWRARPAAPVFDPAVEAPGQVIARHELPHDAPQAAAARRQILGGVAPRALRLGFEYDYGTREVVRLPAPDEALREFENALAGYPRHLDLCEALVERDLDDGSLSATAAAFGHAYTDRGGGVYPGITLYDAHASGTEIEMPDVDVLGVLHALLGGALPWRAPIPASEHEALYARLGELFTPLQRHRSLRHALARLYLRGSEPMRDGFWGVVTNFHALWEECGSDPSALRARLPKPADRMAFLEDWTRRCRELDGPFQAGVRRQQVLDQDSIGVRATLLRVLVEYGALPPATGPAPTPAPSPNRGETPR